MNMEDNEGKRFLTIAEAAKLLGVSKATIRRLIAEKTIMAIRAGKKKSKRPAWRIDRNDFEAYIQRAKEWEEEDGGL